MQNSVALQYLTQFNPLDKSNLGESIVGALENRPLVPLGEITIFDGAGVYALYYFGAFPAYAPLASRSKSYPIYVGKAVPFGARKGKTNADDKGGTALFRRLKEHADSIREVDSLNIDDFLCRFLSVDDIWIPLAETLLITKYAPLWNVEIEGFGNHDPGAGRSAQRRSLWDELHCGRKWAKHLREAPIPAEKIIEKIDRYFNTKFHDRVSITQTYKRSEKL